MDRITCTHEPAASPQEAAVLTAMNNPGRLVMPLNASHFRVPEQNRGEPRSRQGSAAGRAILYADGVNMPGVRPMSSRRGRMRRVCP